MDMNKVIGYVNTNRGNGRKESLNRLFKLLDRLGNPQNNLNYIHITGTNGKGSTSAMFYSVLREANLNVGIFTSPHLEIVNERIRFNGEMIEDEEFIRIVAEIEPVILELEAELGEHFYAFELLTTVAFLYFQKKQPDIILLEAGIGGRLDSTNVIADNLVSVITSIGLDHMKVLGQTKEEIMYEKVQILKKNGRMVVGPVEKSLQVIAQQRADAVNGFITFLDKQDLVIQETTLNQQVFTYKNWQNVKLSMLGTHQIENACLVLEAVDTLRAQDVLISQKAVYEGLEKASWPGRFEEVLKEPLYYIDGAHNEDGVRRLVETLEGTFPDDTFHFVIGMMKDKAYEAMIGQVKHLAKGFILVSPDPYRGFDPYEVAEQLRGEGFEAIAKDSMADVLTYIKEDIPKDETVIEFGSLYLVGEVKRLL